jgi:hypothetical protein
MKTNEKTPEYRYYSTQRPVDIGTFPKTDSGPREIVNFDQREPVEPGWYRAWGYLIYSAPLTEKQLNDYELKPAFDNADLVQRMEEQAQTVGSCEDMKRIPEEQRLTWFKPSIHAFALKEPIPTPELLAIRYELAVRGFAQMQTREDQAQVVGKWEKAHRVPIIRRLTWWYPDFGVFVANECVTAEHLAKRYKEITDTKARVAEKRAAKKAAVEIRRDVASGNSPA